MTREQWLMLPHKEQLKQPFAYVGYGSNTRTAGLVCYMPEGNDIHLSGIDRTVCDGSREIMIDIAKKLNILWGLKP